MDRWKPYPRRIGVWATYSAPHNRPKTLPDPAERILTAARAQRDSTPEDRKPRVFFAQGADGLDTTHSAPINRELLDLVGAVNVGATIAHHGTALTLEQVGTANPTVIVTLDAEFQRTVFANDAWRGIDAVRDGRATAHLPDRFRNMSGPRLRTWSKLL